MLNHAGSPKQSSLETSVGKAALATTPVLPVLKSILLRQKACCFRRQIFMKRVLTKLALKLAFITTHVAFDSHLCHPNLLEGRFRQDGLFCGERYFLLSNVSNTFTLFETRQRNISFPAENSSQWKTVLTGFTERTKICSVCRANTKLLFFRSEFYVFYHKSDSLSNATLEIWFQNNRSGNLLCILRYN